MGIFQERDIWLVSEILRHKSEAPLLKNAPYLLLQFVLKVKTRANLDHLGDSNNLNYPHETYLYKKSNILDDIIFSTFGSFAEILVLS